MLIERITSIGRTARATVSAELGSPVPAVILDPHAHAAGRTAKSWGHGSFSITPRLVAQVCSNGYTITKDAMREVHLGGRLGEGVVRWSADTQRTAVDLISRQAADAAATFLTGVYLTDALGSIERQAGVPVRDVPATIKYVAAQLRFTEDQQATILDHFIGGADRTAGGILQAVTSAAQVQADADVAYEMERVGLRAMTLAAAHQD